MNNVLDIKKMIEVATFDIIHQLPKDELSLQPFQAAIYLGVSTSVLQKMRKKGEGPEWYIEGNKILYPSSGIKIFVKKSTFVHNQVMKKLNMEVQNLKSQINPTISQEVRLPPSTN